MEKEIASFSSFDMSLSLYLLDIGDPALIYGCDAYAYVFHTKFGFSSDSRDKQVNDRRRSSVGNCLFGILG